MQFWLHPGISWLPCRPECLSVFARDSACMETPACASIPSRVQDAGLHACCAAARSSFAVICALCGRWSSSLLATCSVRDPSLRMLCAAGEPHCVGLECLRGRERTACLQRLLLPAQ